MAGERLDKILSSQNIGSRKQVGQMIRKGRVCVAGVVVRDPGYKVEAQQTAIQVDGEPLTVQRYLYLMMNKPQGVISASNDPKASTVVDLVPESLRRKGLFPAGRLDKDTEGFVLLTDDGQFAHDILSPRKHIPKTYVATVDIPLDQRAVEAFAQGIDIGQGQICKSAQLRLVEKEGRQECIVVLQEGMYHQIKRMFGTLGGRVLTLKRIRMGNLDLDEKLAPGQCRELTEAELQQLKCLL